ncbi:TPT-domain-containing protein [Testicularia cyperi]|uniref:TPT-domain-containing protein n=1 Tax=Testicularia cyperi TaxID=1882483 RepID=A0A317XML6_9BASI|nr:TPT-domain-containing protein [Testicularia cyperi]
MSHSASDSRSIHTDRSHATTDSHSESDILFFPTTLSSGRNSADLLATAKHSTDTARPPRLQDSDHHHHHHQHDDGTDESQPLTGKRSGVAAGDASPLSSPYHEHLPLSSSVTSNASTTPISYGGHHTPSSSLSHSISQSLNPGAYWRLAEQASSIPSTRALEHQQGGTLQERQAAYWRAGVVNVLLILCWYTFSTAISVYNKWMFSADRHNFSFPLFVTSVHMFMQFGLSALVMRLFPQVVPRRPNGSRSRPSGANWIAKVVPCALATALDIGLSNTSLKTITLTFYTMCKSSNLAFVLFFAFLFGLEVIRWSLIGIIALITIGVVMMVAAETKFVLIGAVQVLSASALGGLRWALTQMLLDRDEMGMNNPIATIFWLAPVMGVCLVSLSAIFESWANIFTDKNGWFDTLPHGLRMAGLMAAPGFLAFGMNLAEFALIKRTSVVTLSVAGIFKEVLTIALASSVFGDELTPINITGLCITLLGITLYNFLKYRLITRGADANVGQEIAGLSELSESIRSRASSLFHGVTGHAGTAEREAGQSGRRAGGAGYQHLGRNDEDEDGLLFDQDEERAKSGAYGHAGSAPRRKNTGESDALELDTQRISQDILSGRTSTSKPLLTEEDRERERQRLRNIEEEANLGGWDSSGERITGQGLVEHHHHRT